MIGSETFIMVAFRCSENSTSCARASSTCAATKAASALRLMVEASTISPALTATFSFSTTVLPSACASSIFRLRSEEHTSELQSRENLVCRLLLVAPPRSSPLFPYTTLFRSRLQVQREQHVLRTRVLDLRGDEGGQRIAAHGRGVDDLAGLDRHLLLQHHGLAVGLRQLDLQA